MFLHLRSKGLRWTRRAVLAALLLTPVTALQAQRADSEPPAVAATERAPESAPIDLNRATEEQLQALPGVGPARARAIVALRERLGGFRHVRQLLRVRGIGRATFRRIRPLVTVAPRPAEPQHQGPVSNR